MATWWDEESSFVVADEAGNEFIVFVEIELTNTGDVESLDDGRPTGRQRIVTADGLLLVPTGNGCFAITVGDREFQLTTAAVEPRRDGSGADEPVIWERIQAPEGFDGLCLRKPGYFGLSRWDANQECFSWQLCECQPDGSIGRVLVTSDQVFDRDSSMNGIAVIATELLNELIRHHAT